MVSTYSLYQPYNQYNKKNKFAVRLSLSDMMSFSDKNQANNIEGFNSTYRYLDDLLKLKSKWGDYVPDNFALFKWSSAGYI